MTNPTDDVWDPYRAAIETARAWRWEIWCARLFGLECRQTSLNGTVTMYHWRGKTYLTNWEPPK